MPEQEGPLSISNPVNHPLQRAANDSSQVGYLQGLQTSANDSPQVQGLMQLQAAANAAPIQRTGDEDDFDLDAKPLSGVKGKKNVVSAMEKTMIAFVQSKQYKDRKAQRWVEMNLSKDLFAWAMEEFTYDATPARNFSLKVLKVVCGRLEGLEGSKIIGGLDSVNIRYMSSQMENIIPGLAKKGSGSGWEKKALDSSKKKGQAFFAETLNTMKGRTGTRYAYANKGLQGPHTFARCFGYEARKDKVMEEAEKDYEKDPKALLKQIYGMYATYIDTLPSKLVIHLAKNKEGVKKLSEVSGSARKAAKKIVKMEVSEEVDDKETKKLYQKWVKLMGAGTKNARKTFVNTHDMDEYNPNLHALKGYEFFRTLFLEVWKTDYKALGGVERKSRLLMMWGQILADLHPFATSFKNNANHDEIKGGGEGDTVKKVKALAKKYKADNMGTCKFAKEKNASKLKDSDKKDFLKYRKLGLKYVDYFAELILGGDTNKGLIDHSAVVAMPKELHGDYFNFEFGSLSSILQTMGLSKIHAEEVALRVILKHGYEKPEKKRLKRSAEDGSSGEGEKKKMKFTKADKLKKEDSDMNEE